MVRSRDARPDFEKMDGLVPAIVQDSETRMVLMLGFMNAEAWDKTLRTGLVTFWSRSRRNLWTKGETSGNHLAVRRIWIDCDNDSLLIEAEPKGPTCHTGATSCFFEEIVDA
ncbi:MAG: phosphoribosyl-AMP cyclohydrolase [Chloroflexi bacterium]|nr:phosphoribosyl-AMP cyclohydrolase [Chloroflexota bacterium]